MVKPDPILLKAERSVRAVSSDQFQEQLVGQRQWVFGLTLGLVVGGEAALWYVETPNWLLMLLPIVWIGFLIHNNALLVLHELWEINDQLSGRKDEFRTLLIRPHNDE